MGRAFVFPGQGSQVVGMGRSLAEASPHCRAVFDEVDESLGQALSRLVFDGDPSVLNLTENTQPALMAVSIAALRLLEARSGRRLSDLAVCVAGHSLGEYSALTAAGSLSVADAARLLRIRGQAMQKAVPVGVGAMAAIMGLTIEDAVRISTDSAEEEVCVVSNDNAPGQLVVSGHATAVERAVARAAGLGASRTVMLPVSAPFHCPLMGPAAAALAEALESVALQPPSLPLVANVTAAVVTHPEEIRRLLVEQVTARVRWRDCVTTMRTLDVEELVELGQGRVLSGFAQRIDKSLARASLGTPEQIDAFVQSLAEDGAPASRAATGCATPLTPG